MAAPPRTARSAAVSAGVRYTDEAATASGNAGGGALGNTTDERDTRRPAAITRGSDGGGGIGGDCECGVGDECGGDAGKRVGDDETRGACSDTGACSTTAAGLAAGDSFRADAATCAAATASSADAFASIAANSALPDANATLVEMMCADVESCSNFVALRQNWIWQVPRRRSVHARNQHHQKIHVSPVQKNNRVNRQNTNEARRRAHRAASLRSNIMGNTAIHACPPSIQCLLGEGGAEDASALVGAQSERASLYAPDRTSSSRVNRAHVSVIQLNSHCALASRIFYNFSHHLIQPTVGKHIQNALLIWKTDDAPVAAGSSNSGAAHAYRAPFTPLTVDSSTEFSAHACYLLLHLRDTDPNPAPSTDASSSASSSSAVPQSSSWQTIDESVLHLLTSLATAIEPKDLVTPVNLRPLVLVLPKVRRQARRGGNVRS